MSRDFRLFLADIIECCDKIQTYTFGHDFSSFSNNNQLIDAVARNLEIIGEAVKNIPSEILDQEPEIPWKEVARFRDLIAHYYFGVKLTVVWNIVENRLDELRTAASRLFTSLAASDE